MNITFLQNSLGEQSSTRLLMLLTNAVIVGVWAISALISTHKGLPIPTIPSEILTLDGLSMASKVVNSTLAERPSKNGPN